MADLLKTAIDYELEAQKAGLKQYEAKVAHRIATDDRGSEVERDMGQALPYKIFCQRHPDYDAELWQEMRALYAGGPKLLDNKRVMDRLFPPHRSEDAQIYKERCARAHYFPYAGSIIDGIIANLSADPVTLHPNSEGDATTQLEGWWQEFVDDVSPEGGERQTLHHLMMDVIREALIVQRAWLLLDLPIGTDDEPKSLLDQERRGLLSPYVVMVEAEYVVDWQEDRAGELEWAMVCDTEMRRDNLSDSRDMVTKTFTTYDRTGWERWQIVYHREKPPKKNDPVTFVDSGEHPWGRVPLACLKLPDGLHAMGKLHSLAREHLNKRNAVAWAEYKALFAVLYEFLAPEEGVSTRPVSEAQEDPDRAINQIRGQGYTNIRGHEDSAKYIGPDVAPFAEARESCIQIMREMHRVMHVMDQSADMSSAALQRSEGSKVQDRRPGLALLGALGHRIRDLVKDLVGRIARGVPSRKLDPKVGGADRFEVENSQATVKEAVELLNGVPIKSPTFKKAYLLRTYRAVMADDLSEEEVEAIRSELETQITAEDLMMDDSTMLLGGEDDEDDDEDDDDRAAARAAALGRTVRPKRPSPKMFSSS